MALEAQPRPHQCRPPEIIEFEPWTDEDGPPRIKRWLGDGSRFTCDTCGRVQVLAQKRNPHTGRTGSAWRDETRHERRKRLGLRWWQASATTTPLAHPSRR